MPDPAALGLQDWVAVMAAMMVAYYAAEHAGPVAWEHTEYRGERELHFEGVIVWRERENVT